MVETIVVACIVAIIAALAGALIALRIERGAIQSIQAEHEAWGQAQENSRRIWERKQAKRFAEAEANLTTLMQEIREDWEAWKKKDAERIANLTQQYETLEKQSRLEQELARLPHVEEMPLGDEQSALLTQARSQWHPAMLRGVDLSGRDLSHRYLRSADLRETRLANANLFMADLSGALLTGANLRGADLSGANLSGADLREAVLADTNLQVADLRNALLSGTNLIGARHLSKQQLAEARFDEATRLDDDSDLTEPQLPIVRITANLSDTPLPHEEVGASPVENHETANADEPFLQQPVVEAVAAAPITSEQPDAPPVDTKAMPEMPAFLALLDEPALGEQPAAVHDEAIPEMSISSGFPDEPAFDEQPDFAPVDIEAISEQPVSSASADEFESAFSEQTDAPLIDAEAIPETPLPLALDDEYYEDEQEVIAHEQGDDHDTDAPTQLEAPETNFATLLPDLESLLEHATDSQFFSPLAPNDSLLDLQVTDRLVEQQEEAPADETHTTPPRPKHHKSKRARATKRG